MLVPKLSRLIYRHKAFLLIVLGVTGLITSGVLYVQQSIRDNVTKEATSLNVEAAPSSVKPKPAEVATYTVPPTDPRYITIPALGIGNTPVVKLGLLKGGAIATPSNIYQTGWYNGSARPGQNGAMFIYGHVSSWTAKGVFYNLKKLQPKSLVTITRGDNKTYTYQVISTKTYPSDHVDMTQVLSPINDKPGLNLMTCTGQLIKGTGEFNERLVVFTSLVSTT